MEKGKMATDESVLQPFLHSSEALAKRVKPQLLPAPSYTSPDIPMGQPGKQRFNVHLG